MRCKSKVSLDADVPCHVTLGINSVIGKNVKIYTDSFKLGSQSKILNNVQINGNVCLGVNCWIGNNVVINSKKFYLGDWSRVGSNCHFNNKLMSSITIGKFCIFASNTELWNVGHNTSNITTFPLNEHLKLMSSKYCDYLSRGDIVIGNDVWIGRSVTIPKGLTIGDGAVVGANSVLTCDVPPYAIVAGVPAKIIKYRFEASKISKLLRMKWWNWDIEKIRSNIRFFQGNSRTTLYR